MKKGTYIVLGIILVLVIWLYSSYNSLVPLNEQADAQWGQVENAYQRRFDLIPNLVNSTKAVLGQEQKVFGDIADARTRYSGATTPDEKAAAATQVESALGRLLVITENYPTLVSVGTVRDLMTELEGTENRINVERNRFNEIVQGYNTKVKTFPTNLIAGLFGFHERSYFKADATASTAPTVNLQ
ncbi:MAG: LemA family protein [Parcubacteria group bacterium]|nr:LemA family protein [Parcubacteria group bacterium]